MPIHCRPMPVPRTAPLFDGSLQGFELIGQPAFCFQGHPEASPGPHDIDVLFEKFAKSLAGRRAG